MRPLIGRLLIAMALCGVAAVLVVEARQLQRSAETHARFATLRYEASAEEHASGVLAPFLPESGLLSDRGVVIDAATADYWQARYDNLTQARADLDRDPDPELLLLAANAAFRASQQKVQPRPDQIRDLELVLQAYATVLKSGVHVPDAAYNYEFVVRLRDALLRPRAGSPADARAPATPLKSELPIGPTIHGRPGGPPPATRGEEFEILAPMELGDREAQPEPTGGPRPLRKG
jgi:hypothetical protein